MIKKIFAAAILCVIFLAAQDVSAEPRINYRAHVENYGWQGWASSGQTAGTTGESRRLEALVIECNGIEYCAHVQNYGWQGWVGSGQVAGTVGENLRMEAIRIQLRGSLANRYDVCYRVHVQDKGWQGWVRNGDVAGSVGKNRRIEAIQIRLVKKNSGYEDDDRYDDDRYNRRRDRRW